MISRVVSLIMVAALTVVLHVMHEYLLCGVFAVFTVMQAMTLGAVMADPKVFD